MTTRIVLAWIHLLALVLGLAGVWGRARALRQSSEDPVEPRSLTRAFTSDTWWGIAALLWLITGIWRLLASTEKSTSFYMANRAFHLKIGLFVLVLVLELWPMIKLIRWRRHKSLANARDAMRMGAISYLQAALVLCMSLAAVTMARGYGPVVRPVVTADSTPAVKDSAPRTFLVPPRPLAPSGSETATPGDIALLSREIAMPIDHVNPDLLHSSFAERRGGGTRPHEALDIMAPRRTPVRAAVNGRVLKLFTSRAGGLMIYATDSSERFILMYGHLDGYATGLRDGAKIRQGETIGYVGSTGNASANAPHLHLAIARSADVKRWSKGTPIDPLPILQAGAKQSTVPR